MTCRTLKPSECFLLAAWKITAVQPPAMMLFRDSKQKPPPGYSWKQTLGQIHRICNGLLGWQWNEWNSSNSMYLDSDPCGESVKGRQWSGIEDGWKKYQIFPKMAIWYICMHMILMHQVKHHLKQIQVIGATKAMPNMQNRVLLHLFVTWFLRFCCHAPVSTITTEENLQVSAPQLPSVLRVEKPDQRFDRGPIAPAGHGSGQQPHGISHIKWRIC